MCKYYYCDRHHVSVRQSSRGLKAVHIYLDFSISELPVTAATVDSHYEFSNSCTISEMDGPGSGFCHRFLLVQTPSDRQS